MCGYRECLGWDRDGTMENQGHRVASRQQGYAPTLSMEIVLALSSWSKLGRTRPRESQEHCAQALAQTHVHTLLWHNTTALHISLFATIGKVQFWDNEFEVFGS